MNKRISTVVDVLWVISVLSALMSFASWFAGNDHLQLYSAIWGCYCLLMAVLLCVYQGGRQ